MIDNEFNDNIKKGNTVTIRYKSGKDSYFVLTCVEENGKSFYIDRDDSFLVVKKYFEGNFSRTYIPISSIIDVKIMSFKE